MAFFVPSGMSTYSSLIISVNDLSFDFYQTIEWFISYNIPRQAVIKNLLMDKGIWGD